MFERTTFFLNGEEYFADTRITLIDLIDYFNYQSIVFIVEYNSFICEKNKWKTIKIQNNDKVEIITIVGGG